MKKQHGQSLNALVPNLAELHQPPTLTAEQFATLDLWSVPHRFRVIITSNAGEMVFIRNTKSLRFSWKVGSFPLSPVASYLRPLLETALYTAAKEKRAPTFKIAGYSSTGFMVFWLPLCRSGAVALIRLNSPQVILWKVVQHLSMECSAFVEAHTQATGK